MLFFLDKGFAWSLMIGADTDAPRRRHGNEMDTYAADVADLVSTRLRTPSMSATPPAAARSRVTWPVTEKGRAAKAVLIGAVPPVMLKTAANPAACRSRSSTGCARPWRRTGRSSTSMSPPGPFYGFNRPGAKVSRASSDNWWRQGMMGAAKAHYDCIKAFSETDFTEDLKASTCRCSSCMARTTRSSRSTTVRRWR